MLAIALLVCSRVGAQWTTIRLSQDGDGFSQVNAVSGGRQGGYRDPVSGLGGPGLWNASAQSWQSLSGGRNGAVYAMWGDMQGGNYQPPGGGVWASLWRGSPETQVFLHPLGYRASSIAGMFGTEQVGGVAEDVPPNGARGRAALWHGSVESFVNLAPGGSVESAATATDGQHQYGWVWYADDRTRAVMWSGTAASVESLDPGPAYSESKIFAAAPGLQAGYASVMFEGSHAAAWRGSAASFVDLNPPGSISEALGACDSAVVGWVNRGGFVWFPSIWMGPGLDRYELPTPAGYDYAIATCVEFFNGQCYVGGYAVRGFGPNEAFLWVGVPGPGSAAVLIAAGVVAVRRRRR
jgi:hypothetical protein